MNCAAMKTARGTAPVPRPNAGLARYDWWLVIALALVLKQAYSLADAAHLQWILQPLAWLLEHTAGFSWQRLESGEWLDAGRRIVLVKGCAGGHFMILSWLAWLWRAGSGPGRAKLLHPATLAAAFAAAWATALAVNALRIVILFHFEGDLARLTALSAADSHRLLGIALYYPALWAQLAFKATRPGAAFRAAALYLGFVLLLPALHAVLLGRPPLPAAYVWWTAGVPLGLAGLTLLRPTFWKFRNRAARPQAAGLRPPGRHWRLPRR